VATERDVAEGARGVAAPRPTGMRVSQMGQVTSVEEAGGAKEKLHSGHVTDDEGIRFSREKGGARSFIVPDVRRNLNKEKANGHGTKFRAIYRGAMEFS
jgi:hypothetical protein